MACGRSNYFKVKNKKKFLKWAKSLGLEVELGDEGRVSLVGQECGWPTQDEDFDFFGEAAAHLKQGSVAVFLEAEETDTWPSGFAVAVNAEGETLAIDLHDIYERAKSLGGEVTNAVGTVLDENPECDPAETAWDKMFPPKQRANSGQ